MTDVKLYVGFLDLVSSFCPTADIISDLLARVQLYRIFITSFTSSGGRYYGNLRRVRGDQIYQAILSVPLSCDLLLCLHFSTSSFLASSCTSE